MTNQEPNIQMKEKNRKGEDVNSTITTQLGKVARKLEGGNMTDNIL